MLVACVAQAQIVGEVVDATDGGPIPYASAAYRGNNIAVSSNGEGKFTIERHNGWRLTVSSVGYAPQVINVNGSTPNHIVVRLKPEQTQLNEVTVTTKRRSKYSRKNNPAVELMRKVIAAKKKNSLKNHDFYQYNHYQKIMFGLNDLTEENLQNGIFKKYKWLAKQVEKSQYNDKLVLPFSVDETVTQRLYRKSPHAEKNVVLGQRKSGVNDLLQTGDILNVVLKDVFTDVDIYEDQIRLLRYPFTSPIGRDAIQFYRYYITDTVYVGNDRCYHLDFMPNNQQDFGFRGQLYVLADSSYQVKRCELSIPKTSDVNWVENMQCMQEFTKLDTGEWVLGIDDMCVELTAAEFLTKFLVVRTTRRTDISFAAIEDDKFQTGSKVAQNKIAEKQGEEFWNKYRQVELTKNEASVHNIKDNLEQLKAFKYLMIGLRALFENYVETGSQTVPSKVDIGPINTIISQNFYDKLRLRASAQTTANLHPHLFLKGYVARGMKSKENYYSGELTYSFNRPNYLPLEFPKRTVSFLSTRDVILPTDKFLQTDKDNVFSSFKFTSTDKMLLYNRQRVNFEYEFEGGTKLWSEVKTEKVNPIGELEFRRLSDQQTLNALRYTESTVGIRYAPGETYVNTKQHRTVINKETPVFSLQHTVGFNGFMGGQYNYNFTEAGIFKRFWLPMSWGNIDTNLKFGAQWNQVPYPLLIMPSANLSYVLSTQSFSLINNMEFLNDRYASLIINWDMSGKIFNRIPYFRRLKWRESISVKCLWGSLTDKNNPTLAENADSQVLMAFPEGCYVMDGKKPYWEVSFGVHNILKLLHLEFVRRLNYNELPTTHKWGIRFMVKPTF